MRAKRRERAMGRAKSWNGPAPVYGARNLNRPAPVYGASGTGRCRVTGGVTALRQDGLRRSLRAREYPASGTHAAGIPPARKGISERVRTAQGTAGAGGAAVRRVKRASLPESDGFSYIIVISILFCIFFCPSRRQAIRRRFPRIGGCTDAQRRIPGIAGRTRRTPGARPLQGSHMPIHACFFALFRAKPYTNRTNSVRFRTNSVHRSARENARTLTACPMAATGHGKATLGGGDQRARCRFSQGTKRCCGRSTRAGHRPG